MKNILLQSKSLNIYLTVKNTDQQEYTNIKYCNIQKLGIEILFNFNNKLNIVNAKIDKLRLYHNRKYKVPTLFIELIVVPYTV